jgi:hypothetical protein
LARLHIEEQQALERLRETRESLAAQPRCRPSRRWRKRSSRARR